MICPIFTVWYSFYDSFFGTQYFYDCFWQFVDGSIEIDTLTQWDLH